MGKFVEGWKLASLAVGAAVFGVVVRWVYVVLDHAPRHHVTSDALALVALAERLGNPAEAPAIRDTIWPPGTSSLLSLIARVDPTLGLGGFVQFVFSVAMLPIIAHTAVLVAGRRAGWLALLFVSLHFGFIHYSGFFLSEAPFQFCVALALWCSALAIRGAGSETTSPWWAVLAGVASGSAWALACLFRPNALPMACFTGASLALVAIARGRGPLRLQVAAGACAFFILMAPAAHRCSTLVGSFCPASSNAAMNIALGQAGEVAGLRFRHPGGTASTDSWVPPALLHHEYEGRHDVPATIYDTPALLSWVKDRWLTDPGQSLVRALGNALDLFRLEYWPDDYGRIKARFATVSKQLFLALVVAPGMFAWAQLVRHSVRPRRPESWKSGWHMRLSPMNVLFVTLTLGMLLVAMGSLGEARYRVPFDAVLIVLASQLYVRRVGVPDQPEARASSTTGLCRWMALGLVFSLLASSVLSAVAHPGLRAVASLAPARSRHVSDLRRQEVVAADFVKRKHAGTAWDAAGNHVFSCTPHCEALEVVLDGVVHTERVELSLDHNDQYLVQYFIGDRWLGSGVVAPGSSRKGLRIATLTLPEHARAGIDRVSVTPLFGDGRYSFGHLRFVD